MPEGEKMKKKTLAIISHTEHYRDSTGRIVGWGSTVREIDHLAVDFDKILHVAVLHEGEAPASAQPYAAKNVQFIPLKPSGGPGWSEKIRVLLQAPEVIRTVSRVMREADVFQFRAPTGMGVYLIPWLTFFVRKKGWFKYAGNWAQERPPLGYRWQRFFLSRCQRRTVTVNGRWPGQPAHCLSFENPCLDEEERIEGAKCISGKSYEPPLIACFVGRLEEAKGIGRILEALPVLYAKGVRELHVVGDGPRRAYYEEQYHNQTRTVQVFFHGPMSRAALPQIFKKSHLFVLPTTASEGFPKVIAEAANYGCISMTSDVSAIPQYVTAQNGYVWSFGQGGFGAWLQAQDLSPEALKVRSRTIHELEKKFTFSHYRERIQTEILP
jgi:glycosyltransferase involved in cell wall biosynthesis